MWFAMLWGVAQKLAHDIRFMLGASSPWCVGEALVNGMQSWWLKGSTLCCPSSFISTKYVTQARPSSCFPCPSFPQRIKLVLPGARLVAMQKFWGQRSHFNTSLPSCSLGPCQVALLARQHHNNHACNDNFYRKTLPMTICSFNPLTNRALAGQTHGAPNKTLRLGLMASHDNKRQRRVWEQQPFALQCETRDSFLT